MEVNRVARVILAYCVFHNFCEIYSKQVLVLQNLDRRPDHFVGVGKGAMRLFGDD